jgi:hypothetical protein
MATWEPLVGRDAADAMLRWVNYSFVGFLIGWVGIIVFGVGFVFHGSALGWAVRSFGLAILIVGGCGPRVRSRVHHSRARRFLAAHFGITGELPPLPRPRAERFEEWRRTWAGGAGSADARSSAADS